MSKDNENVSNLAVHILILLVGSIIGLIVPYRIYYKDLQIIRNAGQGTRINISYSQINASLRGEVTENIRVLCWVMTMPKYHHTKALQVKNSWGKRCDILLFMSSKEDKFLPSLALNVEEGRIHLFEKTTEALKHIYKYYINHIDWFLKADDDTYVILENLKYFLAPYNPSLPLYFGCKMTTKMIPGLKYMYGGAGYVLSREAVKQFIEKALPNPSSCFTPEKSRNEDMFIGQCLSGIGIEVEETYDGFGRERFLHGTIPNVFKQMNGMECCSNYAISFHYITPKQMQVMEYFLYNMNLYGVMFEPKLLHKTVYRPDIPFSKRVGKCKANSGSVSCKKNSEK